MKEKLCDPYTELMEKIPDDCMYKGVECKKSEWCREYLFEHIRYIIHYIPNISIQISKQGNFPLENNPKKDKPLGVQISDDLHLKKYLGWAHNQQRVKDWVNKKLIQTPLRYIFDDNKLCGTWYKQTFPINQLKKMEIEVVRKSITGEK